MSDWHLLRMEFDLWVMIFVALAMIVWLGLCAFWAIRFFWRRRMPSWPR